LIDSITNIVSQLRTAIKKLNGRGVRRLMLVAGLWIMIATLSFGATKTWQLVGAGSWATGTNWSGGTVPLVGDDVIINITVAGTITDVPNISLNSLSIGGTANLTLTATAGNLLTIGGAVGTDFSIAGGSTLIVSTNLNITLAASATSTINGTLQINSGRTFDTNGASVVTTVNGTINNSGTISAALTKLIFSPTGIYNHTSNGGTIPSATWDAASNCNITGIVTSTGFSGGLEGQTFGNFTWDCGSQNTTVGFILDANFTVAGDFTVSGTGTVSTSDHVLRMSNSATGYTINVGGDFVITNSSAFKMNNNTGSCFLNVGGNFTMDPGCYFTIVTGDANSTLTVTGNVSILGGTFNMQEEASRTGTLNVGGDFSFSGGTITESASGSGIINFNGSSVQNYFKNGGSTFSNSINFTIASGSILDVGTSLINGSSGTFNLNSGAGIITGHVDGLSATGGGTGSIRVGGTRTFSTGANYTYNGTSAQVTGSGLTGANNLTINNSAGLTLSNAVSVAGTFFLTNGILTSTAANLLSITNTSSSAISGGSTTSFINGPVRWTLPANMISGSTYNFPVGNGITYLPFSLVNPVTGSGVIMAQVEANTGNTGGTFNGTLVSISPTEYWSLVTTGNFTNSSVSLTRQTDINPLDVIGGSTTLAGTYTSLEGTAGTYGVTGSNAIGTNRFFVLAGMMQTITTSAISGSVFCRGVNISVPFTITGTFTAGNVFTAQLSDATGSFASPVAIGTLTSTNAGTIPGTIPAGIPTGTLYRIRVVSSTPVRTGSDNGSNLTINLQPVGPTLNVKTPNQAGVCNGELVSATFNAGSGGVGCSDVFQYSFDNSGSWFPYTPGNSLSTTGHN
jgi:hypothetical protein